MNKCDITTEKFEKYKKILLDIIYTVLPGCEVYLFGSRARCEHDSGADIDLAIDNKDIIERKKLSKIKEKIEETTIPLHVDLIDLNNISETLRVEIQSEGLPWKN